MTRVARGLALAAGGVAAVSACGALFTGWIAPDNLLSLWTLVAFCR